MSGTRPAADSYRPKGYGMSAALLRARRPYRTRNALVGIAVAAFAVGTYVYSIRAVKQEDFSDIDVLAPPTSERGGIRSIEDDQREKKELKEATAAATAAISKSVAAVQGVTSRDSPVVKSDRTGILQSAASSTPDSVVPAGTGPESVSAAPTAAPFRGYGARWVSKYLPAVLHPSGGTFVWAAPDVDRIGTLWDRRTVPGEKRQV